MTSLIHEPMTYTLGKLYETLCAGYPNMRTKKGFLDVSTLAKTINFSEEAVYKSFRNNDLSRNMAKRIIECSEGRLTITDLLQFIFI